ncbi:MAG TPA: GGDEF domain-containing protein, partial [Bacilli bacterium]|nr:GGDEF domain-containing protein [Bacilli bacterium]
QNQLVVTDYLTGLYNRRRLAQKLNEKIMYMKENTLIGGYMIDINNFKLINDEYGHNYGDKTIQDVASILLRLSRPDDLVSRFGGDEFVIIRNLKSISELREFKHLVIDGIDEFNKKSGKLITVQIGIGAQIYTKKDDYTAERFLQIIDDLMYKNKKMIKQLSEQQKDPI